MSNGIYNLNEPFSFEDVTINPPTVTNGGNYFMLGLGTRILKL